MSSLRVLSFSHGIDGARARHTYRVLAPHGGVVFEDRSPKQGFGSFTGANVIGVVRPRDGEREDYRIDLRAPDETELRAPIEGSILDGAQDYAVPERADVWMQPVGKDARIELTRSERQKNPGRTVLGDVRLENAGGSVLLETTLLAGGERSSASISLDKTKVPPPFHLHKVGGFGPRWEGTATEIVAARTPEQARALAGALGSSF